MSKRSGAGGGGGGGKRKRGGHWGRRPVAGSLNHLKGGTGFLVTTDQGRERQAAHAAIDRFTEYADRMYPRLEGDAEPESAAAAAAAASASSSLDASELVARELRELKAAKARLHIVDMGSKGLTFIRVSEADTAIDSVGLVRQFIHDLLDKTEPQMRHCIRVMPMQHICNASLVDLVNMLTPVLEEALKTMGEEQTFAIRVKRRSCGLSRDDVVKAVAGLVPRKADLKNPDLAIVIECIRSMIGVCVVRNFAELGNFNVRLASEPDYVEGGGRVAEAAVADE